MECIYQPGESLVFDSRTYKLMSLKTKSNAQAYAAVTKGFSAYLALNLATKQLTEHDLKILNDGRTWQLFIPVEVTIKYTVK